MDSKTKNKVATQDNLLKEKKEGFMNIALNRSLVNATEEQPDEEKKQIKEQEQQTEEKTATKYSHKDHSSEHIVNDDILKNDYVLNDFYNNNGLFFVAYHWVHLLPHNKQEFQTEYKLAKNRHVCSTFIGPKCKEMPYGSENYEIIFGKILDTASIKVLVASREDLNDGHKNNLFIRNADNPKIIKPKLCPVSVKDYAVRKHHGHISDITLLKERLNDKWQHKYAGYDTDDDRHLGDHNECQVVQANPDQPIGMSGFFISSRAFPKFLDNNWPLKEETAIDIMRHRITSDITYESEINELEPVVYWKYIVEQIQKYPQFNLYLHCHNKIYKMNRENFIAKITASIQEVADKESKHSNLSGDSKSNSGSDSDESKSKDSNLNGYIDSDTCSDLGAGIRAETKSNKSRSPTEADTLIRTRRIRRKGQVNATNGKSNSGSDSDESKSKDSNLNGYIDSDTCSDLPEFNNIIQKSSKSDAHSDANILTKTKNIKSKNNKHNVNDGYLSDDDLPEFKNNKITEEAKGSTITKTTKQRSLENISHQLKR